MKESVELSAENTESPTRPGSCVHCGTPLNDSLIQGEKQFCCRGCEIVYQTIHGLGLGRYYSYRGESRSHIPAREFSSVHHAYADSDKFREQFCRIESTELVKISLIIEGIHCAACVWVLERLPMVMPSIRSATVRFAEAILVLTVDRSTPLSLVLTEVERMGYRVRPLPLDDDSRSVNQSIQRTSLVRLGVAAVCALNTMMLSVSLYQGMHSGIESSYRNLLQWYSLALTLPVVFYSALPFYRTALGGLRSGVLHIDLPIVIALLSGFILSVWETVSGGDQVYFDSVAAVVFLLLASRYLQSRVVSRLVGSRAIIQGFLPLGVLLKREDGSFEERYVETIRAGDVVRVVSGAQCAVDGEVLAGVGHLNTAFLTGESAPHAVAGGDTVYAGTTLVSGQIDVVVQRLPRESRLGRLINEGLSSVGQKPEIEVFLDSKSRGFTALVVIAALGTLTYWIPYGFGIAIERAIALLLVTCPCVLALATPIVFSVALLQAARRGIFIRGAEVIERIQRIQEVFFDKTGTITTGVMSVCSIVRYEEGALIPEQSAQTSALYEELRQMERGIDHPVASAIREVIGDLRSSLFAERTVVPGAGVSLAYDDGRKAYVGSPQWNLLQPKIPALFMERIKECSARGETAVVYLSSSGECVLFQLGDVIREQAQETMHLLSRLGIRCSILSGDLTETAAYVAHRLAISRENCFAPCSPEEKRRRVAERNQTHPSMMVGDGINDVGALSVASVGVGLRGGLEASLKVADVYISDQNFSHIGELFTASRRVMRSVRVGLVVSLIYNLVGCYGAVAGYIGPLEAAILMPLSSLTSIGLAATRRSF